MHPLPPKYFGTHGLPCRFTTDDDTGATSVGYLVKQISTKRFIVSDGSTTRIAALAQTADAVADPNNYPPATVSIYLSLMGGGTEHICYITTSRCSTIEGTVIAWHTDDPTATIGSVAAPDDGDDDDFLLENGDRWLLENGTAWELETPS